MNLYEGTTTKIKSKLSIRMISNEGRNKSRVRNIIILVKFAAE